MSGYTTSGLRSNVANSYIFAHFDGNFDIESEKTQVRTSHAPTQSHSPGLKRKAPPQPPNAYTPTHKRSKSGTKYDVRSTYSPEHVLHNTATAVEEDTAPCPSPTPSSSQHSPPAIPCSCTDTTSTLTPDPSIPSNTATMHRWYVHKLLRLEHTPPFSSHHMLDSFSVSELTRALIRALLHNALYCVVWPFEALGKCFWEAYVERVLSAVPCSECVLDHVDGVVAAVSAMVQHGGKACVCEDKLVAHGIDGQGWVRFLLRGETERLGCRCVV